MAKKLDFFYFDHQKCGLSTIKRKNRLEITTTTKIGKNHFISIINCLVTR